MKDIIINTQEELDCVVKVAADERLVIKAALKLGKKIIIEGDLIIEKILDCSSREDRCFVARGNAAPYVVARGNAAPHVVAWGNAVIQASDFALSVKAKISLFGFATISLPFKLKCQIKKSKTAHVQRVREIKDWFERNDVRKTANIILFKRVSKDFKTQEGTEHETDWTPGKRNIHPNWNPKKDECGSGKYHGCSWPYFGDEFRDIPGDRYVAVQVALEDTYAWPNPKFPYKIAFRAGTMLYECDRWGEEIKK